jgi:hypothetical protein
LFFNPRVVIIWGLDDSSNIIFFVKYVSPICNVSSSSLLFSFAVVRRSAGGEDHAFVRGARQAGQGSAGIRDAVSVDNFRAYSTATVM